MLSHAILSWQRQRIPRKPIESSYKSIAYFVLYGFKSWVCYFLFKKCTGYEDIDKKCEWVLSLGPEIHMIIETLPFESCHILSLVLVNLCSWSWGLYRASLVDKILRIFKFSYEKIHMKIINYWSSLQKNRRALNWFKTAISKHPPNNSKTVTNIFLPFHL